jgi:hypothetical protein
VNRPISWLMKPISRWVSPAAFISSPISRNSGIASMADASMPASMRWATTMPERPENIMPRIAATVIENATGMPKNIRPNRTTRVIQTSFMAGSRRACGRAASPSAPG